MLQKLFQIIPNTNTKIPKSQPHPLSPPPLPSLSDNIDGCSVVPLTVTVTGVNPTRDLSSIAHLLSDPNFYWIKHQPVNEFWDESMHDKISHNVDDHRYHCHQVHRVGTTKAYG